MNLTMHTRSSQPARAVWIEIILLPVGLIRIVSQPARAVWIEIPSGMIQKGTPVVTACEGCVD